MEDKLQSNCGSYVGHWKNGRFVVQNMSYYDAIGMKDEISMNEVKVKFIWGHKCAFFLLTYMKFWGNILPIVRWEQRGDCMYNRGCSLISGYPQLMIFYMHFGFEHLSRGQ